MDIKFVEELLQNSTQAESTVRVQAIELLDRLRGDASRWTVGLQLFFEGSSALSRFFGLSLLREYMSCGVPPIAARQTIRETMMTWLLSNASELGNVKPYVFNNIVTVVTLAVKHDFPELWPAAFSDILSFGQRGTVELDLANRILSELDVEVVMFNAARGKEEVTHNTIIKDAIRSGPIAGNIVQFLCTSAIQVRPVNAALSARCLKTLSEMIGWIDNGLIVNNTTLPIIYQALADRELTEAALTCLLEIVKKGMDPFAKIQLIAFINIIPMLSTVKIVCTRHSAPSLVTAASAPHNHLGSGGSPSKGYLNLRRRSNSAGDGDDDDDDEEDTTDADINKELAAVLDVLLLELLGCWIKYEDLLASPASTTGIPAAEREAGAVTSQLMHAALPLALQVFSLGDYEASELLVPSLNKFVYLLKQQQSRVATTKHLSELEKDKYFMALTYLSPLLTAVIQQMQYPQDFQFDGDSEDDVAEMEAKKQIRKLFVNCCRVDAAACLQMVTTFLSSLPQPLSKAPFAPLEAILRLIHAFAECGSCMNDLVSSGVLPQLLTAIFQSDVLFHHHTQVKMAYFELCARYARLSPATDVKTMIGHMLGPSGLRHRDEQLRNRTAYLLLKVIEAVPPPVCTALIPSIGTFSDLILLPPGAAMATGSASPLAKQSELYLLEAVGVMTSVSAEGSDGSETASIAAGQLQLLSMLLDVLTNQLQSVLNHPDISRYGSELAEIAAHKLSSIAALCRGHSYKSKSHIPADWTSKVSHAFFVSLAPAVALCTGSLAAFKPLRDRGVVYFHRMIQVLGAPILNYVRDIYLSFLLFAEASEMEGIVQLANQLLLEFGGSSAAFIDDVMGPTLDRIVFLYTDEGYVAAAAAAAEATAESMAARKLSSGDGGEAPIESAPYSFEVQKVALQKQYLNLLHHIAAHGCHSVFISSRNISRLDTIFSVVMQDINGGGDGISVQGGITLRRNALVFLSELSKDWVSSESPVADSSSSASSAAVSVPSHISVALWSFVVEQALPVAMSICMGRSPVDVRNDVQSQSILTDTGVLIYALLSRRPAETVRYLTERLLPQMGWPHSVIGQLSQILDPKMPVGTFKESFKKLIRQNLGAK